MSTGEPSREELDKVIATRDAWLRRLLLFFVFAAGLVALVFTIATIAYSPLNDGNDHKIAPSLGILKGYLLYYGESGGPVLSTIYGPVVALAYLPAVLFKTPNAAVQFSTLLTVLYFLIPAVFLSLKLSGDRYANSPAYWGIATAIFLALVILHDPLRLAFSVPHADPPALGFGALAVAFAFGARGGGFNVTLCALFTAASVLSKQNMAPLPLVIALWFLARDGWKTSLRYCAAGILIAALFLSILTRFLGSPSAFWLNLVDIPAHQPYQKVLFFLAIALFLHQCLPLAAAPIALILHDARSMTSGFNGFLQANQRVLPLFCAAGLGVTSIMGFLKAGGSMNSMSPSIYFLAIALAAELIPAGDLIFESAVTPLSAVRATLAILVLSFALGTEVPPLAFQMMHRPNLAGTPMTKVFNYAKAHPGEVYFPHFPLSVLMAEGRLYHFAWGLQDRAQGGHPVKRDEFLRYIPPAPVMGLVDMQSNWDEAIKSQCGDAVHPAFESGFPGFRFCALKAREPALPLK